MNKNQLTMTVHQAKLFLKHTFGGMNSSRHTMMAVVSKTNTKHILDKYFEILCIISVSNIQKLESYNMTEVETPELRMRSPWRNMHL